MNNSHELGKLGENLAADYLKSQGYTIVDQNWKSERYEVDIICVNKENIVFVEVKTHDSNKLFDIRKLVDKEKQRKITLSANRYVRWKNITLDVRFDIIIVIKQKENYDIQHIPDAFYCVRR
ncbi:YraN family protein [Odoribacter sp. OttesenSCG-928-L07]|nr:YraN family protein [Odoribacter sp. OttesenSCG-928-L07]MDL2238605.1 YraN family protein [Bacteroidales bacterium OttesenSCG-928-L14]MDL2240517.1 YraN family protein [Bacteroidales bacterium OttesenSCG-928-K22]